MPGVLVVAETSDAGVTAASLELLGAARMLADQGAGTISAFVAGDEAAAQSLVAHGAETVFTTSAPASSMAEVLAAAVEEAIAASGADIVLTAQTSLGRDLGPLLAFRLDTGVSMETTGLSIQDGRLRATRAAYGGNARAEHTWRTNPQIATVKGTAFDPAELDSARSGTITPVEALGEARIAILSHERTEAAGLQLEDAAIVVSGGRGLGDAEAFRTLEELAATLKNAAVGASRAACDLGWYPPSQQIGLTGKVVSPSLYIAVAISGASQHMAGMASSRNVVAINKDRDAAMVRAARFAVVEDYRKVLPALIEEIKKLG